MISSNKNTPPYFFYETPKNKNADIYQKNRIHQKHTNTLLKHISSNLNNIPIILVSGLPSPSLFLEEDILNIVPRRLTIIYGLKLFQKNIQNKNTIFSHFHHTLKTAFHHVCKSKNIGIDLHQLRIKTCLEEGRVLLFPIKHTFCFYYHVLDVISMLIFFSSFIIHLFIIIYNLLSIYSLLFLSLLVYIFYYFLLFLDFKNERMIPQKKEGCVRLPSFYKGIMKKGGLVCI